MKIEHITKLILKFMGGGIVNFPTRFLKWIKVESCDCDGGGGDDEGGDEGGDSQDTITLEDFNSFYISVLNNNYPDTYRGDETLQISDLFDVPNINIFKGLLNLGNMEINDNIDMNFSNINYDPDSGDEYNHSITIHPHGGEFYDIEINTRKIVLDDNENPTTYIYSIGLRYDGEDTLTVGYVNTPKIEQS